MNELQHQHYHFTGIGGIGMSALAQLLVDRGARVSGSDQEGSPVTELLERTGITVVIGQHAENIPEDTDVLVYSDAVSTDNVERASARERGIPERSYFEELGILSRGKRTIAVAGTHGKTTTAGMLARVLRDAGAAPSAIIGSIVRDFGSNYLHGDSDILVVEACEYKRHFLNLSPQVLVVTNIEFDHTDYFANLADVQDAFRACMEQVPVTGAIVTDVGHPNIAPLLDGLAATIIDYTREPSYQTKLPGEFNSMNARAAAAAARVAYPDITPAVIQESIAAFDGTWRRFEYKGKTPAGADVYDDYAHHPTAIRNTLAELRKKTHGRLFVAFHPHLYSRTRDLLPEFATAFSEADEVLVAPIYPARELDDGTISNTILAEHIRAEGVAVRAGTFAEIEHILRTEPKPGDVVMTMGAGDIYKVADALVALP